MFEENFDVLRRRSQQRIETGCLSRKIGSLDDKLPLEIVGSMASEQVGSRKKQPRSSPKEELRHPVLYRHQDCIPNPKLLQTCERNVLLGLKSNQSHDAQSKVVAGQDTSDNKISTKKLNSTKTKHDDKSDKAVQELKIIPQQSNGTLGNNEELSKSRKRRLRKRRLLVALAPTLSSSKPSPPPPVGNNQTVKPISRPIAQSSPAVPLSSAAAPNRSSEPGKPSVKESRKRPEKSINSRSKSLKSKSLAETTHHSKADIIKTLEEKTLSSLLQTLVPLTNSSPKKEKPSLPLFSFPEKKFTSTESKVDKDGVFYFGETKHQLEKLSSSFSNYSTSPFSDKSDAAQNKELNRNCFSASKISSLENVVPSFNFSQTVSDRSNCSPAVRQNLFGAETVSPSSIIEGNNIFSIPSAYQRKDLILNSPVLKDLNQLKTELRNFSSPTLTTASSSAGFVNRPNNTCNIPASATEPFSSVVGLVKNRNNIPVNITEPKSHTVTPKLVEFPQNSCVLKATRDKDITIRENNTQAIVNNTQVIGNNTQVIGNNTQVIGNNTQAIGNNTPAIMKLTGEGSKSNKSREEILLEREAKKAAKLAARAKKAQISKEGVPSANTSKTESESIVKNQNDNVEDKVSHSSFVEKVSEKGPESKADARGSTGSSKPAALKPDAESETIKPESLKEGSSQDAPTKSKAELKAERRAKQEAQRAVKAAAKTSHPQPKEKVPAVKTEQLKPVVGSTVGQNEKKTEVAKTSTQPKPKLFSHLYREKTKLSSDKLLKVSGLHPAVVRLGVQYATRVVLGSNARCVALLRALIQMVNDYTTPLEKDFSRGLEEELGPVTRYLDQCRPLAVSMTNALRHLSRTLTQLPNSMTDAEAKRKICDVLETYIHEQINIAGKSICEKVKEKIVNGDVILIYGCSSLLYQILVESHMSGIKFRVVVVDGLPWLEGREMLRRLVEKGISCTYVLITAASFIMREATKVLLGAHALLANGYVMSRAGSSQVALLAHSCNVPVLVCCENHKFCERAQTDAFVYNELGELHCARIKDKGRSLTNLTPLSLAYDVTPPDLVTAVVTELAVLPCTSVPVILRIRPSELAM